MSNTDKITREFSDLVSLYVLIFGALLVVLGAQLSILLAIYGSIGAVCLGFPVLISGLIIVSIMLKDKIYHRFIFRPAYPPYAASQPSQPAVAQPPSTAIPTAKPVLEAHPEQEYPVEQQTEKEEEEESDEEPPPDEEDIPYAVPAPYPVQAQNPQQPSTPPQYPGYYPPYYSGYAHPAAAPYYGAPYVTYIQYFRETLSIPHIRTLLIIFTLSIIGGSAVLIAGFPSVLLFPIFFIIAFTFPSFIWISYVYHKDVLEPESKHAIFLTLTWGMFSTIFAIFPNNNLFHVYRGHCQDRIFSCYTYYGNRVHATGYTRSSSLNCSHCKRVHNIATTSNFFSVKQMWYCIV